MKNFVLSVIIVLVTPLSIYAQTPVQTADIDGLRIKENSYYALTDITIVPSPGITITNGILIIKNGIIENVGAGLSVPKGATIRSAKGMWVYAAFIEPYMEMNRKGAKTGPANVDEEDNPGKAQPLDRGAKYWNEAIRPEKNIADYANVDAKTAEEWMSLGFGAAHCNATDGILRGHSAIVLMKEGSASTITLRQSVGQWMSLRKGNSPNPYPSSMMGSIALLRQAFYDALWYGKAHSIAKMSAITPPEINSSLEALADDLDKKRTFFFETNNEHTIVRGDKIAKEFSLPITYIGNGFEYRRLSSLTPIKPTLILPVNFPAVPDVSTAERAEDISLEDLLHWDAAPANPYRLDSVGISFSFTTRSLKNKSDFLPNIRKAISYGLSKEKALAALTQQPAKMLGIADILGSLEKGKIANLLMTDGDIFDEKTSIYSTFVAGKEFTVKKNNTYDIRGKWAVAIETIPQNFTVKISGERNNPRAKMSANTKDINADFSYTNTSVQFSFSGDSLGYEGKLRASGTMDSLSAKGTIIFPDNKRVSWTARRDSAFVASTKDTIQKPKPTVLHRTLMPDSPFGLRDKPVQKSVLLKNAKIWTCSANGEIIEKGDVLIANGKIAAVGTNLSSKADTVIDATGKHITPGIIDEHSHIAIESGVNEGTHAVTAEVRIGDVLQPDDINIYRQLAGGVTSSHLLHGSANPIGGQLQLIKLRWGSDADNIKFADAEGTIKFALGENVKQSHWGDNFTSRYPQTRMGVEEIMRDGFQAALEYEKKMKEYDGMSAKDKANSLPPRRDIQLDILLEILRSKRFIHCHSYVQSEILMLMRLAEEFNFKIQNFTHILEGYKLASEMAKHGTTASSFADWWAYKFEVYDAIPQNPAILHEQGVVTSINSDDAEMARRLNQEAGKAVKYGKVSETEALKMVTLNPAIQLRVQDKTGSLEKGKDADIVVWSSHPLSNFARVEHTFVDGIMYFDRTTDEKMRLRDKNLRAALEQKAINALSGGESPSPKASRKKRQYDCEDVEDEMQGEELLD
jgi:imidazolonepropionase-like amidohydrolase